MLDHAIAWLVGWLAGCSIYGSVAQVEGAMKVGAYIILGHAVWSVLVVLDKGACRRVDGRHAWAFWPQPQPSACLMHSSAFTITCCVRPHAVGT